jgi:LysM repeat protein
VAVSNQPYIVLETAYQTPSGKMQWGAEVFLTKIAASQAACAGLIGLSTQNAEYGDLSQYSVPVAINTARPDGDVVHEVQYGQTLWSIAIQYDTTIEQIKRLNNLTMDTIVPGWTLLIQKGATQPAAFAATSPTAATIRRDFPTPTPRPIYTPATTEIAPAIDASKFIRQNSTVVVALVISFSVLVAGIVGFGKRKGS